MNYAGDAVLHAPLGRFEGRAAIEAHLQEQRDRFRGLRAARHDHFTNDDGTRACFRHRLTWDGGTSAETRSVRLDDALRDGRIARLVVGDSGFAMPHQELVTRKMDFPAGTTDPDPEI